MEIENSEDTAQFIAKGCLQGFSRLVLRNLCFEATSGEERIGAIEAEGKCLGKGALYDCNACCADALLQLLAKNGFVPSSLLADGRVRKQACMARRAFLINHEDARLHPKVRSAEVKRHKRPKRPKRHKPAQAIFLVDTHTAQGAAKVVCSFTGTMRCHVQVCWRGNIQYRGLHSHRL